MSSLPELLTNLTTTNKALLVNLGIVVICLSLFTFTALLDEGPEQPNKPGDKKRKNKRQEALQRRSSTELFALPGVNFQQEDSSELERKLRAEENLRQEAEDICKLLQAELTMARAYSKSLEEINERGIKQIEQLHKSEVDKLRAQIDKLQQQMTSQSQLEGAELYVKLQEDFLALRKENQALSSKLGIERREIYRLQNAEAKTVRELTLLKEHLKSHQDKALEEQQLARKRARTSSQLSNTSRGEQSQSESVK